MQLLFHEKLHKEFCIQRYECKRYATLPWLFVWLWIIYSNSM